MDPSMIWSYTVHLSRTWPWDPLIPLFHHAQTSTCTPNVSLQHSHRTVEAGRQPASTFSVLPLHASFQSGAPFSSLPASCHLCMTSCMSGWSLLELEEILGHQTALCTPLLCRVESHGILPIKSLSRPKPALMKPCSLLSGASALPFHL